MRCLLIVFLCAATGSAATITTTQSNLYGTFTIVEQRLDAGEEGPVLFPPTENTDYPAGSDLQSRTVTAEFNSHRERLVPGSDWDVFVVFEVVSWPTIPEDLSDLRNQMSGPDPKISTTIEASPESGWPSVYPNARPRPSLNLWCDRINLGLDVYCQGEFEVIDDAIGLPMFELPFNDFTGPLLGTTPSASIPEPAGMMHLLWLVVMARYRFGSAVKLGAPSPT